MKKLLILILVAFFNLNSYGLTLEQFNTSLQGAQTFNVDVDLGQVQVGNDFIKLDSSDYHTVIGSDNTIINIPKLNTTLLETIQSNAQSSVASLVAQGKIIRPNPINGSLGRRIYLIPETEAYNINNYVSYLISMEDNDLYDAFERGLVGECKLIKKELLPLSARMNFPCSQAVYIPRPLTFSRASTFPKEINCIPGSIRPNGRPVKCLSRYSAQMCRKPTLKERTVAFLRNNLNHTLENPSNDVCNIASVVNLLNESRMSTFSASNMADPNKVVFRNDDGQIRCFAKIDSSQAYLYADQQLISLDGSPTIELHSKSCKIAYYRNKRQASESSGLLDFKDEGAYAIPKVSKSEKTVLDLSKVRKTIPLSDYLIKKHERYVIDIPQIALATQSELDRIGGIDISKLTGDMVGPIDISFNPNLTQNVIINPISTYTYLQNLTIGLNTNLSGFGTSPNLGTNNLQNTNLQNTNLQNMNRR